MAMPYGELQTGGKQFDKGRKVAMISAASMVFLTVLKGSIGIIYGSVALQADAVNSLSDILASALVWSGLKLANRDPDEKFPYGYYRAETLASLTVAVLVIFTGIGIIWESFLTIFNPTPIRQAVLPLIASATSAIIYYILARYKRRVGEEIGSNALIADSAHSLADVWAGVIVFAGILFSNVGYPQAEILVAIVIGLYIAKEGMYLARDSVISLMDATQEPESVGQLEEAALNVDGVIDAHDIRLRRAGPVLFGEMHISVSKELPLEHAHRISNIVNRRVCEAEPELESMIIHLDPAIRKGAKIAIPVEDNLGLASKVSEHFARAPFILFYDESSQKATIMENPGTIAESKRGVKTAELILDQNTEILVTNDIGPGPFGLLMSELVTILEYPEGLEDIKEIIHLALSDQLAPIENPSNKPIHDSRHPSE